MHKRFWKHVRREGDCFIWTKSTNLSGYGQLTVDYVPWRAHRYAYTLFHGPIGDLKLHHICRNRRCVRPAHLEPVDSSTHGHRHTGKKSRAKTGSMAETRPGVWRLRVYVGRNPSGSPIQASRTFRGARSDADAALEVFLAEVAS